MSSLKDSIAPLESHLKAVPPQINVLATAILVISLILLAAGTLYRRKGFRN